MVNLSALTKVMSLTVQSADQISSGVRVVNVYLNRNCATGTLIVTTELTKSSVATLKLNFNVLSLGSVWPASSCATVNTTAAIPATSC